MVKRRKKIDEATRDAVFQKLNGRCWYCGDDLDCLWHIDHMHPVKHGGTDELYNLIPSCWSCNSNKSAKHIEDWRLHRTDFLILALERTAVSLESLGEKEAASMILAVADKYRGKGAPFFGELPWVHAIKHYQI